MKRQGVKWSYQK